MANSDCILFMGSNMAEAQPVGFRWPMEAKHKGATLMHVDPRFTRMSAVCDVYVGIRSGSDITFLGGLVNYVLGNDRWFHEYVVAYTNAATIIEEGFRDTEDLEGLFSGYDPESRSYNATKGHWVYEGSPAARSGESEESGEESEESSGGGGRESGGPGGDSGARGASSD